MIAQYDTTYTVQLLVGGAPSGTAYTLCCNSDTISQESLAIIKRVHSCCPRDANGNPIPNILPIPDCPQIEVAGPFAADDGTDLTDPPKFTPGTPVEVTVNGGFNYTLTGYVTAFGDSGQENSDRQFRFVFIASNMVIINRT